MVPSGCHCSSWQGVACVTASGAVDAAQKQDAVCRWAASSVLADILAHKHIGGPDMRMGEEMAWVMLPPWRSVRRGRCASSRRSRAWPRKWAAFRTRYGS